MNVNGSMQKVFKHLHSITKVALWISYVALAAMILVVIADVLGRFFLSKPLQGSYELVLLFITTLGGFAMMQAAIERGHVSIDLLTVKFPKNLQNVMQRVTSFLGFAVWTALAIQLLQTAMRDQGITDTLFIHTWPFKLAFALATFLFSFVLLAQALEAEHATKGGIQE